jgi:hypothetical protein
MNFKIFQIPSVYTIWDGLSLKSISRYCPFKTFLFRYVLYASKSDKSFLTLALLLRQLIGIEF